MPLGTTIAASYSTIILTAVGAAIASAGAVMLPDQRDAFAVSGAMLGSVLAVLEALKRGRDFRHLASVFIASSAIGGFGPGATIHWMIAADKIDEITWHVWSAAGFVFALAGWATTHACMSVFMRRIPTMIEKQVDRFDPPSRPTKHEDP